MEVRTMREPDSSHQRSFSSSQRHHGPRKIFKASSYFSSESLVLLIALTASLLLLPLILPPLPPPPLMLLVMLPICILGVLMILAFMPNTTSTSKVQQHALSYTYVPKNWFKNVYVLFYFCPLTSKEIC